LNRLLATKRLKAGSTGAVRILCPGLVAAIEAAAAAAAALAPAAAFASGAAVLGMDRFVSASVVVGGAGLLLGGCSRFAIATSIAVKER
jgi:hypothetical protein